MQSAQNIRSYQLHIYLQASATIAVGMLGACTFPQGTYIYTGSVGRNIEARVARHLRARKKLRWHIDYLLNHACSCVLKVSLSADSECELNQSTRGTILIPRFGSTDCTSSCGSHLKYLEKKSLAMAIARKSNTLVNSISTCSPKIYLHKYPPKRKYRN